MHYVSLIIEFLRGRPVVVFWTAALTQAALWTVIPALFYSAPPGGVPILLAIGHEFELGSYLGPPLAFWLGEAAFRIAGSFGLYALAQACVVVTYWGVFALGRAIVGTRHAVLAVLLMVGITAYTVPSPDFGPAMMAAPLWSLALLHYWRAMGEASRGAWFLLALDLGLLLLASYAGLVLLVLMVIFTLAMPRGREALKHPEPYIALLPLVIVAFPHFAWLWSGHDLVLAGFDDAVGESRFPPWLMLCLALLFTHAGLMLLVALGTGWPRRPRERAPEIDRNPTERLARLYVYFFALAPAAIAVAIVVASGHPGPFDRVAPLVVLSGLAIVVLAGDRVLLYRERLVSSAWLGLLCAPPAIVVFGLMLMPWISGKDLAIAQPAGAEGRFFADSYQRRIGEPLQYVTGDARIAPLVALAAPSRPHVYFDWAPQRSPWADVTIMREHGGLLVWPVPQNTTLPPATLRAQFPDLVAEVPRSFARAVQGFLPLIRIGWAVVRPEGPAPAKP
ncbi:MAG TPA: glycosyltransferase family 39 protein [Pseudolabrys sp.]|nr:glycosyltransferase family 39 protein [Pseudolabrys sp.]